MNDTDVRELARLAPAPHPIALSDRHKDRLSVEIAARIERSDVRRRRAAAVGTAALVTACVAAVAALVATTLVSRPVTAADRSRPVAAAPGAVAVLRAASTVAAAGPAVTVASDQYVYVRSRVITNEGRFGEGVELGRPHEREIWLGQRPEAVLDDGSVIREFGQDWPLGGGSPTPPGTTRPTYAWLAALPTDPDDLLDAVMKEVVVPDREEPEQALFDAIGGIIAENLVPPGTAAALYEAATRIPGVEVTPDARDAIGRQGIGVSREGAAFQTSSTWVFDEQTHELLGVRWYLLGGQEHRTLFGATAVLERGVSDQAGVPCECGRRDDA